MPASIAACGDDEHHPARLSELARALVNLNRADSALEPDLPRLDPVDHQLILDPVLLADIVNVDVRRIHRDLDEQVGETIRRRKLTRAIPRAVDRDLGRV